MVGAVVGVAESNQSSDKVPPSAVVRRSLQIYQPMPFNANTYLLYGRSQNFLRYAAHILCACSFRSHQQGVYFAKVDIDPSEFVVYCCLFVEVLRGLKRVGHCATLFKFVGLVTKKSLIGVFLARYV